MNTKNLFKNQFQNNLKTFLLMAITFAVVGILGYFISLRFNNINYLYIFLAVGIVQNVIAYWFSGSLAIRSSGAIKADINTEEGRLLISTIERLSRKADLKVPEAYIIPDENMNAFATGRDQEHAKVAATTGLLKNLSQDELDGVIAHELGHIGNKDILISSVVAVMAGIITNMIYIFSSRSGDGEGRSNVFVSVLVMLLAPFAGLIIQMAVSRNREYQADATAAAITENPRGLMGALEKIHAHNVMPLATAKESTAHMYIDNPFVAKKNFTDLFMTHPPVEKRIEKLRSYIRA